MPEFGELRSLLNATPSRKNWKRLCIYLEDRLSQRPDEVAQSWLSYSIALLASWPDALRLAPPRWLDPPLSPLLPLARAICLDPSTPTLPARLSPGVVLTELTLDHVFDAQLATDKKLVEITLRDLDVVTLELALRRLSGRDLRHLHIHGSMLTREARKKLLSSRFAHLDTLTLDLTTWANVSMHQLTQASFLPNLRELTLANSTWRGPRSSASLQLYDAEHLLRELTERAPHLRRLTLHGNSIQNLPHALLAALPELLLSPPESPYPGSWRYVEQVTPRGKSERARREAFYAGHRARSLQISSDLRELEQIDVSELEQLSLLASSKKRFQEALAALETAKNLRKLSLHLGFHPNMKTFEALVKAPFYSQLDTLALTLEISGSLSTRPALLKSLPALEPLQKLKLHILDNSMISSPTQAELDALLGSPMLAELSELEISPTPEARPFSAFAGRRLPHLERISLQEEGLSEESPIYAELLAHYEQAVTRAEDLRSLRLDSERQPEPK